MQDPTEPVQPGAHPGIQSEEELLPFTELEWNGQSVHVPLPSVGEYVPAGQSKQLEAPSVGEYVPAGQSKQLEAPSVGEYIPLGHTT